MQRPIKTDRMPLTQHLLDLMRHTLPAALLMLMLMASGCQSVNHTPEPYVLVGQPYPIEVRLDLEDGEHAEGTVHYRNTGERIYREAPMQILNGGKTLAASLPIDVSAAGRTIEYYINIQKGQSPVALGSTAYPHRARVVTLEQMVARTMNLTATGGHAGHPLTFKLYTGDLDVISARLVYQAPGLPGTTSAAMTRDSGSHWALNVPGEHVQAGWWNYRVETVVEGLRHAVPPTGWDRLEVVYPEAPPERRRAEVSPRDTY